MELEVRGPVNDGECRTMPLGLNRFSRRGIDLQELGLVSSHLPEASPLELQTYLRM